MAFQEDGDIVLTDAAHQPVRKSRTSGNPGATLPDQADGNVVLYASDGRVVWHTGTAH